MLYIDLFLQSEHGAISAVLINEAVVLPGALLSLLTVRSRDEQLKMTWKLKFMT
jgi:hypothetical protein